jgi:hypothetical protein
VQRCSKGQRCCGNDDSHGIDISPAPQGTQGLGRLGNHITSTMRPHLSRRVGLTPNVGGRGTMGRRQSSERRTDGSIHAPIHNDAAVKLVKVARKMR